mgnify:CR=1 FL=1
MILGKVCTRDCRYCNVQHGNPEDLNLDEPKYIAKAVKELGLKYVVITSVTRDDLDDYGSEQFVKVIKAITKCRVEVLIPDFKAHIASLKKVSDAEPDVIAHNIEVVEELFSAIRPQGDYKRSLDVLKIIKKINPKQIIKSGLMIGLGEDKKSNESKSIDDDITVSYVPENLATWNLHPISSLVQVL